MRLLLWLILALEASATVLRVPADYPGVQQAMDASQTGDTVRVDRGVWTGLLDSPVHTLLLCSNYPFTLDSTDIVETVLDGEYAGTILKVNTVNEEMLTVTGFTFWRGQGVHTSNGANCNRAGAVQMEAGTNGCFTDIVFAECRATRRASVLFKGTLCSPSQEYGDLVLRRIHARGNTITDPVNTNTFGIYISTRNSSVIIEDFYWDGQGGSGYVLNLEPYQMDTLALSNVQIVNCESEFFHWDGGLATHRGSVVRDIYSEGCGLSLPMTVFGIDSSVAVIRNIEVTGMDSTAAIGITTNVTRLDIDSLHVHHNRLRRDNSSIVFVMAPDDRGHVLRNLNFHDNIQGDSTNAAFNYPHPFISLTRCDLIDATIRNNTVIMAPDPNVGETPGNAPRYSAMLWMAQGNRRLENVLFENNRVDDLDVYTDVRPHVDPKENAGREFMAWSVDTMVVRNLIVRNSRMDNPIPEVIADDDIGYSGPGFTIQFGAVHLDARGILLENCDDGGILFHSGGELDGAVLRNVKRTAIGLQFGGTLKLRNVSIEALDGGGPNWLQPEYQHLSRQCVIWAWGGTETLAEFENVTVNRCHDLPNLINFWANTTLSVRNSLFYGNEYLNHFQYPNGTTQNWDYNIVQEQVPGIGNQVGIDPWFDEELGAPWLSPISPAIDAGNPDLVYNDIEDPDNPGFALWPSQGTLRNDIGYTGGPHLFAIDTSWVALQRPKPRPTALPQGFTLHSAYPNPFNPSTTVSYTLARPMQVELSVYNLLGQQVRTLAFGLQDAGEHSVPFIAGELASGVYVVELQAGGHSQTQKVLLLK
jgi:hypothetical protein